MRKNKIYLSLILLFFGGSIIAQNQINSPYSRFGIGNLQSNVLSEYAALGGTSIASYNPNIVNPYNPASYTAFKANSFIFSLGGTHQSTKMQTANLEQITNNSSFSHFILGLPISKKIGASAGFLPYSNIGYQIEDSELHSDLGLINYSYLGDGGLNIMYVGMAYRITNNLSLGANANYLFGGLYRNKKVIFTDGTTFNTRKKSSISVKGFFYQLGLMYNKDVNENTHLSFGFTANNNAKISAKRSVLTETYELFSSVFEVVKDTAENTTTGFSNNMILPQNIAVGFSLEIDKKWLLMTDFSMQDWSEYRMFGESDSLTKSMKFSGGLQFTPDYNSVNKYWKLIKFRFGGKFEQTYLQLYNTQLTEKSVSFGFGLPLRKTKSEINLSVEMGEKGTTNNNLIKEQFLRFQIGLSLRDIWFVKRKYD
ncbi:MAG: hypothetical protein H8E84_03505 [Flavobacteriales bacterium]|nr:hypothetical protein [Flavobacteriales bacterium]